MKLRLSKIRLLMFLLQFTSYLERVRKRKEQGPTALSVLGVKTSSWKEKLNVQYFCIVKKTKYFCLNFCWCIKLWFLTNTQWVLKVWLLSTCTVPSSCPRATADGCLHRHVHRILDDISSDWNSTDPVLPSRTWNTHIHHFLRYSSLIPNYHLFPLSLSLLLTCSRLQLSAADTMMSSPL